MVISGSYGVDAVEGEIQIREYETGKKVLDLSGDYNFNVNFTNNDQWIQYNNTYFNLVDIASRTPLVRLSPAEYEYLGTYHSENNHTYISWENSSETSKIYTAKVLTYADTLKEDLPLKIFLESSTTIRYIWKYYTFIT